MAKHISDFSKLPDEVVFDLINEQNGTALNNTMVTLGTPVREAGVGVSYNTNITVTALETSDYAGSVTLGYNRLDVEGFLYGETLTLPRDEAVTFADLIPAINERLKTNITTDDYVDGPIGAWQGVPNETKQIVITMKPSSKVFIGSLRLTLAHEEIPLSTVIVQKLLLGLVYQPPGT